MWKATKVEVMMSYVELEFERQVGSITQQMTVYVHTDDMSVKVTCSTAIKEDEPRFTRSFHMTGLHRRHLRNSEALERLFNEVFFSGRDC